MQPYQCPTSLARPMGIYSQLSVYCMCIKFCGLIFRVFDWQENSWGINFRDHGGMISTVAVGFAKYASYCNSTSE